MTCSHNIQYFLRIKSKLHLRTDFLMWKQLPTVILLQGCARTLSFDTSFVCKKQIQCQHRRELKFYSFECINELLNINIYSSSIFIILLIIRACDTRCWSGVLVLVSEKVRNTASILPGEVFLKIITMLVNLNCE